MRFTLARGSTLAPGSSWLGVRVRVRVRVTVRVRVRIRVKVRVSPDPNLVRGGGGGGAQLGVLGKVARVRLLLRLVPRLVRDVLLHILAPLLLAQPLPRVARLAGARLRVRARARVRVRARFRARARVRVRVRVRVKVRVGPRVARLAAGPAGKLLAQKEGEGGRGALGQIGHLARVRRGLGVAAGALHLAPRAGLISVGVTVALSLTRGSVAIGVLCLLLRNPGHAGVDDFVSTIVGLRWCVARVSLVCRWCVELESLHRKRRLGDLRLGNLRLGSLLLLATLHAVRLYAIRLLSEVRLLSQLRLWNVVRLARGHFAPASRSAAEQARGIISGLHCLLI